MMIFKPVNRRKDTDQGRMDQWCNLVGFSGHASYVFVDLFFCIAFAIVGLVCGYNA